MASTATCSGRSLSQAASSRQSPALLCRRHGRHTCVRPVAALTSMEKGMFGENFGARDATPAEVASNFSDKVLGNWDTEHLIKPPDAMKRFIGLLSRSCKENVGNLTLLTEEEVGLLRQQAPGWKVSQDKVSITQSWRAKDGESAQQLVALITQVSESEGHPVDVQVRNSVDVDATLTTASVGGLSLNDFIVAANINELDVVALLPKPRQRFWA